MSKSKILDKIQNPDIPGFETSLAPPPPPIISVNPSESIPEDNSKPNKGSFHNRSKESQFAPGNHPWWIPTETDSEVYTQWYKSAYKAALQAAQDKDPSGKPKVKYYKRKAEVVDAKVDAAKVANAQKELCELMKPLQCDLCNAVMNSTLQARLHYQGKPHQKKVSMYLNQSAKKIKIDDVQVSSTTNANSDWTTYCEICKIWFTSQTDANQHYSGKKHLKAAFGQILPKLPKKPQDQSKIPEDPTGRFGIGTAFQPEPQIDSVPSEPESLPIIIPPVPQYVQAPIPIPTPLRCDICGISANRQDQLDTHKRGARHLKMMKQRGLPLPVEETVLTNTIDYSIYRTPSGQYYCSPCNISLNSEITFGQHMESKKHKNKVNPKAATVQPVVANKSKKK